MASYIFTDLLNRAPSEIRQNAADARDWLRTNLDRSVSAGRLLKPDPDNPTRISSRPNPGTLNMFIYDAKTKAKLPYFDKFPLMVYTNSTSDGFLASHAPKRYRLRVEFEADRNAEMAQNLVF